MMTRVWASSNSASGHLLSVNKQTTKSADYRCYYFLKYFMHFFNFLYFQVTTYIIATIIIIIFLTKNVLKGNKRRNKLESGNNNKLENVIKRTER